MYRLFLPLLFSLLLPALPATAGEPRQDLDALRQTATGFLRERAAGLPGNVDIEVDSFDPRLNLPACPAPQAFLSRGSRAWGKTTVGVRCAGPARWSVYVAARVKIVADYVVVATPLAAGQLIGAADVATVQGDLTALPAGVVTDPAQAVGRTAARALALGTPLREDTMRTQQAIRTGQTVQLVTVGPGFRIAGEGRAIGNANAGQIAQARTAGGQVVSGIARLGGVLEVRF